MKRECGRLLKIWCDRLLEFQIKGMDRGRLDGALLCPACQVVHGRCQDMIYPLLCLYRHTGEERYRDGALALFDWGESLVCDDGSFYNDGQSSWNGITVFGAASLWESLVRHGDLLDEKTRERFEDRMRRAGQWIYKAVTKEFEGNINYHAAGACAMAMVGTYEKNSAYLERAGELAASCLEHITEDGLFYGEGKPRDAVTKRGCRPMDIGYNVEESLPALLMYGRLTGDSQAYEKAREALRSHLDFMMPDGGWDNSFGTRNFKWTYWGSRTSDGCLGALALLGKEEPVFWEAAWRNLKLLEQCTHKGLLTGGPDYGHFGAAACLHHSFCHAKTLAQVMDDEDVIQQRTLLPCEEKRGMTYYPVIDTYRIFTEKLNVTVTAYDFEYLKGGHGSGGVISMAWHRDFGPILASSMTVYSLYEAHNMQQVNCKAMHQSLTPEAVYKEGDGIYRQCFDTEANMRGKWAAEKGMVWVSGTLKDAGSREPENPAGFNLTYETGEDEIIIKGRLTLKNGARAKRGSLCYVLPVLFCHDQLLESGPDRAVFVKNGKSLGVYSAGGIEKTEPIFNLAGGWEAWKLTVLPDAEGRIFIHIYS